MNIRTFTILPTVCALIAAPFISLGQTSFTNMASDLTNPSKHSGVALCIQDMNGDRLDDIVCLDQGRNLYIEYQGLDGTWTYLDGPEMDAGSAWGVAAGDVTNNGYGDVISGLFGGRPDYARANANGTSYTVSELPTYSLATQCVNLADIDADGDLDFFSCGDTGPSGIWENNGSGDFTYSGDDLIQMTPTGNWDGSGNYGSTFTDYDLDGDLDFYITHCRQGVGSSTDLRRINQMFINDGNGNYSEDFTNANGLRIGAQSWTTDFQDFDNDGDFDAFITNHDVNNMLLENVNGVFTDIYNGSGLDMSVGTPIQGLMRDFDNDMYVDIIVTGSDYAYFHNNGDNTFTKIPGIFGGNDMESLSIGDLNHDGFLDIYGGYASIYTTPTSTDDAVWINDGNDNHWIVVDLEGTISNKSAIGAVVRLYGPWGQQVREVRAGESYGISNTLESHFGLAGNMVIDSVVVDWPSSNVHTVITDPIVDQFLTIKEGDCVAPQTTITSNGPTVICAGETLQLDAPIGTGYSYMWSTGATSASISVTTPGTYMVQVTATNGCAATSPATIIEVSPDETPTVSVTGDLEICEGGSVMLTSSSAQGYTWSNSATTQSITVSQGGNYTVTIEGACADFTSETIVVGIIPAAAPTADDVTIGTPQTVTLNAVGAGTEMYWFDAPTNGNQVATGTSYTTPVLNSTTSYWVEEVHTVGGGNGTGGKADNNFNEGQYHQNSNNYLIFTADQDFIINSVRVFANSAGNRTIEVVDGGVAIATTTVNIPSGESVITLDFFIPAGTDYGFRTVGNPDLWRDNDAPGVNFPYAIASYGSITGTTVTGANADNYYYFFYDWEVSLPAVSCTSVRDEATVTWDISIGVEEVSALESISAYPNPATEEMTVEFAGAIDSEVSLTIIDMAGKVIISETIGSVNAGLKHNLNLQNIAGGAYMLKVNSTSGSWTDRIMIK